MIRALISAELIKLYRQPGLLFWGFLSAPAAALALKIAFESVLFIRSGKLPPGQADLFTSAAQSLGIAGNPFSQLLYAIGISSVFFTEYRFSTWRNLVPRVGRIPPLVAKWAACLLCTVIGLVLAIVGDVSLNTVLAFFAGSAESQSPLPSNGIGVLITAFAIAVLELSALGSVVAALTIAFRSMLAAIVPVFLLAIGTSLLQAYLGAAVLNLPLPSLAADALRAWLFDGADGRFAALGIGTLFAWCVTSIGIGTAIFSRQALSSE